MNRQAYAASERKPTKTAPPLDVAYLMPKIRFRHNTKARARRFCVRTARGYSSNLKSSGSDRVAEAMGWLLDFFNFPVSASGRCPRSRDIPAQTPEISAAAVGSERHQT